MTGCIVVMQGEGHIVVGEGRTGPGVMTGPGVITGAGVMTGAGVITGPGTIGPAQEHADGAIWQAPQNG